MNSKSKPVFTLATETETGTKIIDNFEELDEFNSYAEIEENAEDLSSKFPGRYKKIAYTGNLEIGKSYRLESGEMAIVISLDQSRRECIIDLKPDQAVANGKFNKFDFQEMIEIIITYIGDVHISHVEINGNSYINLKIDNFPFDFIESDLSECFKKVADFFNTGLVKLIRLFENNELRKKFNLKMQSVAIKGESKTIRDLPQKEEPKQKRKIEY
jgi:hypothetical protein